MEDDHVLLGGQFAQQLLGGNGRKSVAPGYFFQQVFKALVVVALQVFPDRPILLRVRKRPACFFHQLDHSDVLIVLRGRIITAQFAHFYCCLKISQGLPKPALYAVNFAYESQRLTFMPGIAN